MAEKSSQKRNEEEKDEGAPELETPEKKPSAPAESTPRDDSAPLETPEKPAVKRAARDEAPRETREETTVVSREEFVDTLVKEAEQGSVKITLHSDSAAVRKPLPKAPDVQVVAELAASAPTVQDPYVLSLFQHVSAHPVDAHAPVWAPRTPNTTGGYS